MNKLLAIVLISFALIMQVNSQMDLEQFINSQFNNPTETPIQDGNLIDRGVVGENENQLIRRLFTTVTPPVTETGTVPPGERCLNGMCVPFHLCNDNSAITDGDGVVRPRINQNSNNQCHYLETCCSRANIKIVNSNTQTSTQRPIRRCGYRNVDGVGFRITKKQDEAEFSEFPWMVAVLKVEEIGGKPQKVYQCGGALIHPKVVLTAAHCSNSRTADVMKIRAGEWDIQTTNEILPYQDRDIEEIINHENYYRGGLHNDISLLILTNEVNLADNVNTVCLPPQNLGFEGSRCFATGWGKDVNNRDGKYQVILKKVDLPIVSSATCQTSLRTTAVGPHFVLHDSFICAGGEQGKDTCKGDGGSPLACPITGTTNRFYQTGIVAWGIGCGENLIPGVYVKVAMFRNWIDEEFRNKGLETSYYTA